MIFTRSHGYRTHNYNINGQQLPNSSSIKDLRIIFDTKLTFSAHIDKIVSQAYKVLGYILRSGKDFKNNHTLVHLFNSLVRPILEYGSIVWSPATNIMISKIEKIQRKLCKYIVYRLRSRNIDDTQ
ncbi:uncharacterized protein LOC123273733 [Cotesia glomerata]|uniref:uncharacterized protein LOC123269736 n=1 Tax=Cotesia glomerata TaxID=32391 RepID=UPI001D020F26|nr:uncharacterized protein LOC123269736 [Cotesia glomerata]XP_044597148.1 uncharacterized protein LOC123273733 [Cotesia glomerata]